MAHEYYNEFLTLTNVGLNYETRNGIIQALNGISFTVNKGQFVSLIGPSGCGKSTLLKAIGDLLPISSGKITIGGKNPEQARRACAFSFVFQNPVLLPWRSVYENIILPEEILGNKGEAPDALLKLMGLEAFANNFPHELSGGMRQRVALARALSYNLNFARKSFFEMTLWDSDHTRAHLGDVSIFGGCGSPSAASFYLTGNTSKRSCSASPLFFS